MDSLDMEWFCPRCHSDEGFAVVTAAKGKWVSHYFKDKQAECFDVETSVDLITEGVQPKKVECASCGQMIPNPFLSPKTT